MTDILNRIDQAVALTKAEEYLRALTMFLEIYGSEEPPSPMLSSKTATGLSHFGLCLAIMQRKFKPAIDLCKLAIELQFYNADHYANLARVYIAAGNRKKAIEAIEQGLKSHAEDETLLEVRRQLGVRAKPPVPFLDRAHPINVTLGQARHAKKSSSKEPRKK
ncbi:MAG TPA: tetratricopeptide repeat protein [Thermoanaerobaculia bacterium]|jgi:tetratricopeptide (TPR) repeat protein|nr:tetratricopeptide repeat protein [Thermoanaerobaculia bacterium]